MKKEQLKKAIYEKLRRWLKPEYYEYSINAIKKNSKVSNLFVDDIIYLYNKLVRWVKISNIDSWTLIITRDEENDETRGTIYLNDKGYSSLKIDVLLYNLYNAL